MTLTQDNDAAFLELVKANSQGELSPLEIGIHALKYVELSEGGRGKKGGLREYARELGRSEGTLRPYKEAAKILDIIKCVDIHALLDKANHLSHISKVQPQYWQQLTELLIEKDWSVKQTEVNVSAIKDIDIPECFWQWLNPETTQLS